MLTKKITEFSADLLDAVRGVLGEAKKCEDCGCAKCECEDDEDDMEEGYVPTADEPSDAAKKTAQKVRDMLAKEKKPVKEDAEQIDEISKATMGRYINKAKDHIDTVSWRQGYKEGGANNPSGRLEKKLTKRHKGISTAVKKLTKEESEQIDELSKKTLGSYVKKAAGDVGKEALTAGLKIKAGENPMKNLNKSLSRQAGISAAAKKLTKEEQDFIDSLNDGTLEEAEKNLTGLPKSTAEKNKQYIEITHHLGHKTKVPVHPTNAYKALNHYNNDPSTKSARIVSEENDMFEEMDMPKGLEDRAPRGKARNAMGRAIAKKERNLARIRKERALNKEAMDYRDGDTRMGSVGPITTDAERRERAKKYLEANLKKRKDNNDKAIKDMKKMGSPMRNPHFGEEAEHIDELSKNTMLRYVSANKKSDKAAQEKGDYSKTDRRMRGTDLAVRKYTAKDNKYVRVPATEETEIVEARGRPKKAGNKDFTIHPKTKEKLMHNNPEHMAKIERLQKNGVLPKPKTEANQHIIQQLQRAKTSMRGGETVHFTHGDSKEVSGRHAAKILDKYAGMKPDEKEAFQKKIGHSHEQLMKHV